MEQQAISGEAASAGYGNLARTLHWLTVLLILTAVPLGLYGASLPLGTPLRVSVLMVHKSIGVTILCLTPVRLAWRLWSGARLDPRGLRPWEAMLARIGHFLLYAILLLMPLSGIMMSQGAGKPVGFFDIVFLPNIFPHLAGLPLESQPYFTLGRFLHEVVLQTALYLILAMHLAGVIKHQFIDGNRTFIRRMWGTKG